MLFAARIINTHVLPAYSLLYIRIWFRLGAIILSILQCVLQAAPLKAFFLSVNWFIWWCNCRGVFRKAETVSRCCLMSITSSLKVGPVKAHLVWATYAHQHMSNSRDNVEVERTESLRRKAWISKRVFGKLFSRNLSLNAPFGVLMKTDFPARTKACTDRRMTLQTNAQQRCFSSFVKCLGKLLLCIRWYSNSNLFFLSLMPFPLSPASPLISSSLQFDVLKCFWR